MLVLIEIQLLKYCNNRHSKIIEYFANFHYTHFHHIVDQYFEQEVFNKDIKGDKTLNFIPHIQ